MTAPFLFDVAMKGSILLAVAWVATLAMRKSAAASRHLAWCAAALAVLCVPLLSAVLPAWRVLPSGSATGMLHAAPPLAPSSSNSLVDATPAPVQLPRSIEAERRPRHSVDATAVLLLVWFSGTFLCLLPPLLGWWRLRRLTRRGDRVTDPASLRLVAQASADLNLHRPVTLLARDQAMMPMTWGVFRPIILVPRQALEWPHDRSRAVLLHELSHVKRLDCLTHLLGQLARAVYWFNPLAWVAVWRMSVERERACDDLVLRAGMRQSDYARELLAVGTNLLPAPCALAAMALAMARPSRMERRLLDVLDEHRNRRPLTRRHVLAGAALATLLTLPLACVKSRASLDAPPSTGMAALPEPVPPQRMTVCQENIAILVEAARQFSYENRGMLPPSLGRTLANLDGALKKRSVPGTGSNTGGAELVPRTLVHPPRPIAHYYLCDTDERREQAPATPTPQWINQNTLYRYIAPDVANAIGKYPPDTVMIHEHVRWKGHGDTINVGFWDGSVRAMDRDRAAEAIERSRARFDAAIAERASDPAMWGSGKNRARNAILVKASSNMKHVALALAYYAADHDQKLPPTLGHALPYGDDEWSIHSRARTYLLPQDQHGIAWPATPTPDWIDRHTSYVYLGAGVDLKKVPDREEGETAILHTKLDPPLKGPGGEDVVLLAFLDGHVEMFLLEPGKRLIEKSRKTLDAARGR